MHRKKKLREEKEKIIFDDFDKKLAYQEMV